ncbi:Glucan endo-1,3-beta-glucosidase A1 precursor [Legionella wadsworthii]|uniref:Glucan endo-1,3-beta-glucosidase A1 n=1 Tax=Legionella wadsworthii TaxID=28088 RepID=A0A378LUX1_9GAMM|nr:glycoside hydrolase family 16 protein [Legionella wadsworthii]STY29629.1 Glucan endo-1,3-beta-glucosidase A1 precursor [Legionella wadsworthii]
MKKKWINYSLTGLLLFHNGILCAQSIPDIGVTFKNNILTLTNNSNKPLNLENYSVQFDYSGQVFEIKSIEDNRLISFSHRPRGVNTDSMIYAATLSREKQDLMPKKSIKLALQTDNMSSPLGFTIHTAPVPINVSVNVSNSNWTNTIAICNTSGKSISLHNIELDFNYSAPMPSTIWGKPWANWQIASQRNGAVVLIGGTELTPDLPPDPSCMRPLKIKFKAAPSTPLPTGPFVFKSDDGVNPNVACTFDNKKTCTLNKDILNDISPSGLHYYGPTNYDHRISGEINVFDASLVTPYTDNVNLPGQLKLTANRVNNTLFKSGEIMTRVNLDQPPYNSPTKITPFTTNDIKHGYIEARIKLPKCDVSDDGLCQTNKAPESYHRGMWPAFWFLPTHDTDWPLNGEIDVFEAYQQSNTLNEATAALHFNGNDPRCGNGDCKFIGYHLPSSFSNGPLFNDFHTWGFEWEPDPKSTTGGMLLNGYFDNVKAWGPIATDSLPADGPNAFARGFHDPNGGFYLITALALGGGYAGNPSSHLLSASMYIQSIKAYEVTGSSTPPSDLTCLPPANIKSSYTADKKQITLTWTKPTNSDTILSYQVNDWQNKLIWKGTDLTFIDKTLPGTNGKFTYFLNSNCSSSSSKGVQYDVIIQ